MRIRVCISDVRNREYGDGKPHEKVEEEASGASFQRQSHVKTLDNRKLVVFCLKTLGNEFSGEKMDFWWFVSGGDEAEEKRLIKGRV